MYKILCVIVVMVLPQVHMQLLCGLGEILLPCALPCPQRCLVSPLECLAVDLDSCEPGCYCLPGLVRHTDGTCRLARSVCCPQNEVFACGSGCQNECAKIGQVCPTPTVCVEGCYCIDGYARNAAGVCILQTKCPELALTTTTTTTSTTMKPTKHSNHKCYECKRNEVYQKRGNPCQATCANRNLPSICNVACRPGCFCKEGYLYNDANGKCVKPSDC